MKRLEKLFGSQAVIDAEYNHKPRRTRSRIRIPGFCERRCNNGWMRHLENEMIPILTPMLTGEAATLTSRQQLTIATWMIVRATVFDCLQSPRFYDSRETSHLLAHVTPPDSTFGVWLGHASTAVAFTDGKKLNRNVASGLLIPEGYVLTMAFGHAVLQVLTIRKPQSHAVRDITVHMVRGPWNQSLVSVWPLAFRPVEWPPQLSFNPSAGGLHFLANRFNTIPS